MKLNRRGFFAAVLAMFLPTPKLEAGEEFLEACAFGEFDEINLTTLSYLNAHPPFWEHDIRPLWSGEIFPTYGSVMRNGTPGAGGASKDSE